MDPFGPYIIRITNTAIRTTVYDVPILFPNQYLGNTGWNNGSLSLNVTNGTVTIDSLVPNVTYQQLLRQITQTPFWLEWIYIATDGGIQNTNNVFMWGIADANGNTREIPTISSVDPYQSQPNYSSFQVGLPVDGSIGFTIYTLNLGSYLTVYFYPAEVLSRVKLLYLKSRLDTYVHQRYCARPKFATNDL